MVIVFNRFCTNNRYVKMNGKAKINRMGTPNFRTWQMQSILEIA